MVFAVEVYQVAVGFNQPLSGDGLEAYEQFLNAIETENPHAMGAPMVTGDYSKETHAFYLLSTKD
ncbi:hypothetical protein KAR91_18730, partial [Candidatus Pacearchaeota archaeon]|nr:hypothetical protein [Candidatus Pacearchaeota archaeon]